MAWAPSLAVGNNPLGLWGVSSADLWCVATGGAPSVQHFDGSAWSPVALPGGAANLRCVFGFATDDVWTVSDTTGGTGTIYHWDGAAWSVVATGGGPHAVWGAAADDVWFVGAGGTIQHWDGATLSTVTSGTSAYLRAVWGAAANDVWAVGEGGVVLHWDGATWSIVDPGLGITTDLLSVHGVGGFGGVVVIAGNAGVILLFDGTTWTLPFGTVWPVDFLSVFARTVDDVWLLSEANWWWHVKGLPGSPSFYPVTEDDGFTATFVGYTGDGPQGVIAFGADDAWSVGDGVVFRWNGPGAGDDVTPPTVTLVSPAEGEMQPGDVVTVEVTDDVGLGRVLLVAAIPDALIEEVVHQGSRFGPKYSVVGNSRVSISGGYRYQVRRDGGWLPGALRFDVYPFDSSGNEG